MSTITIGDDSPHIKFTGDGIVTNFSFSFPVFEETSIEVYFGDKQQTSGFTVTKSKTASGGEVNFDQAPPANTLITITRNLEIKRTTNFSESQAFRAKMLNYEFDYLVACLKQISDDASRSISLPIYAEDDINFDLPNPEAGKALVWDEEAHKLRNSKINMEEMDAYVDAAQEAQNTAEMAMEIAENISQFQNTITETSTLAAANQAELGSKLNKSFSNLSTEGYNYLHSNFICPPVSEEAPGIGKVFVTLDSTTKPQLPAGGTWFAVCLTLSSSSYAADIRVVANAGVYAGGSTPNINAYYYPHYTITAWRVT